MAERFCVFNELKFLLAAVGGKGAGSCSLAEDLTALPATAESHLNLEEKSGVRCGGWFMGQDVGCPM